MKLQQPHRAPHRAPRFSLVAGVLPVAVVVAALACPGCYKHVVRADAPGRFDVYEPNVEAPNASARSGAMSKYNTTASPRDRPTAKSKSTQSKKFLGLF